MPRAEQLWACPTNISRLGLAGSDPERSVSEEPWNKGPLSARRELLLVLITLQSWRELWENVGQEPARAEVKGSPTPAPSFWPPGVYCPGFTLPEGHDGKLYCPDSLGSGMLT